MGQSVGVDNKAVNANNDAVVYTAG
jgi:hypothetical protein